MAFCRMPRTTRPRILTLAAAAFSVGLALLAGGLGFPLYGSGPTQAAAGPVAPREDSAGVAKGLVKGQYARALAEYYAGEYSRAQVLFSGISDQVPGYLNDDVRFWRAECAFRLGDLQGAEAGFKEFLNHGAQGPRAEIAVNRLKLLQSWGG